MARAQDETGEAKLFSANIRADDYHEMCARADYVLETFGENASHVANIRVSTCTTIVLVMALSLRRL